MSCQPSSQGASLKFKTCLVGCTSGADGRVSKALEICLPHWYKCGTIRPNRLIQCCIQFKPFGDEKFCSEYFHIVQMGMLHKNANKTRKE